LLTVCFLVWLILLLQARCRLKSKLDTRLKVIYQRFLLLVFLGMATCSQRFVPRFLHQFIFKEIFEELVLGPFL
jgi:hypothetical protein